MPENDDFTRFSDILGPKKNGPFATNGFPAPGTLLARGLAAVVRVPRRGMHALHGGVPTMVAVQKTRTPYGTLHGHVRGSSTPPIP